MKPRGFVILSLFSLVALSILISLGLWQLQRKEWKEGVIGAITARTTGEAKQLPPESAWGTWNGHTQEYQRVRTTGTFLHEKETLVRGLISSGTRGIPNAGFFVITPLVLENGSIVLVNRGFVPNSLRDPASRASGQVTGKVEIRGLLRSSEQRGWFVPENKGVEWFTKDIAAIAADKDLARVAPFLIDADAAPNPGGWPSGGHTVLDPPNNHLSYALTWFGLALTLVGVYVAFLWRHRA